MIFDTHTHYDDEVYDADRDELMRKVLPAGNIGMICNIGNDMKGARDTAAMAAKYPNVYGAIGVHPDEVGALNEDLFAEIKELAKADKIVAIGETGLDYHGFDNFPDKPDRETQQYWFKRQLELAHELKLPVVIHSRNAAQDTLEILEEYHDRGLIEGAVIHCYSYSKELAQTYIDMGFYIGVGGVLTYDGQKKLTKVVEMLPMDRILLETDCPYLTPVPVRAPGERNLSTYLTYVVDKIAQIKGVSPEDIEIATWANAHRFYAIDKQDQT